MEDASMSNEASDAVEAIAAIEDPQERAAAAAELLGVADARLVEIRDQAITQAVAGGASVSGLAAAVGLSRQSIYNIAGKPIPRRQCGGTTSAGTRCRAVTTNENGWCGRCAHPPEGVGMAR